MTLQLLPDANLPLGSYTGTISLLGAAVSLNVPFQFKAVSAATGNVVIDAQDEMTLLSEGSPMVAGASVIISDPQTGDAVASGTTGSDGTLELDQLPIGTYNVEVQADGHNPYQGAVTIQPGLTATVDAFMINQLVTYQFNVTPTEIPDVYTFTVNTTFTTHVPAPVVTVSPDYIDFNALTANTTVINFTYTNHGLIAADNVTLHFDSNDQYQVTPLVNEHRHHPRRKLGHGAGDDSADSHGDPLQSRELLHGEGSGPASTDGCQPARRLAVATRPIITSMPMAARKSI